MSLQAYKTAATRAETPRQAEYRLFGQVTRALMHAATLDKTKFAERMDALDWNRRLWSTLATACSDSGNGLPQALRISIGTEAETRGLAAALREIVGSAG